MTNIASESGERSAVSRITENTTIRMGLALILAGYIFGTAWWAASMNAKVDSLITMTASIAAERKEDKKEIDALKERVWKLELRLPVARLSGE